MKIRGTDRYGSGAFGAPRGGRAHRGVDLVCEKGDLILSPVEGVVTKLGYPYDPTGPKGHKRYVQVTTTEGLRFRFFYIEPQVSVEDEIRIGDTLGKAQGLQDIYPGITDHIHFEIKDRYDGYLDPTSWVEGDSGR